MANDVTTIQTPRGSYEVRTSLSDACQMLSEAIASGTALDLPDHGGGRVILNPRVIDEIKVYPYVDPATQIF